MRCVGAAILIRLVPIDLRSRQIWPTIAVREDERTVAARSLTLRITPDSTHLVMDWQIVLDDFDQAKISFFVNILPHLCAKRERLFLLRIFDIPNDKHCDAVAF